NARLLAILARDAADHGFSRARMEKFVTHMINATPSSTRRAGKSTTDQEIVRHIQRLRRQFTTISRTAALRKLRRMGIACEQGRFGLLWPHVVAGDSVAAEDAVARLL